MKMSIFFLVIFSYDDFIFWLFTQENCLHIFLIKLFQKRKMPKQFSLFVQKLKDVEPIIRIEDVDGARLVLDFADEIERMLGSKMKSVKVSVKSSFLYCLDQCLIFRLVTVTGVILWGQALVLTYKMNQNDAVLFVLRGSLTQLRMLTCIMSIMHLYR